MFVLEPLLADLIHADLRKARVVGTGVDTQHILHLVDKQSVLLGGNAPLLFEPGLQFVFFSVRRTVS